MNKSDRTLPQIGMSRHFRAGEWHELCSAHSEVRRCESGEVLAETGKPLEISMLLLEGILARHVPHPAVPKGSQMVALSVPGDFADLHAFPLKRLDHNVTALTEARVAIFPHSLLQQIVDDDPGLAVKLWALTLVDASLHRHWAFRNGALRALARVANLICEIDMRLPIEARADETAFYLPLSQREIAEAVGLSAVHVNRVMRDLKTAGACTVEGRRMKIIDRNLLRKLGQFDEAYLYRPELMTGDKTLGEKAMAEVTG